MCCHAAAGIVGASCISMDAFALEGLGDLWVPQVPNHEGDFGAFLLFAMSWCVQRRIRNRDSAYAENLALIERVRRAKQRGGYRILPEDDITRHDNLYVLPALGNPYNLYGPELDARKRWLDQRKLNSVASWLYVHFGKRTPQRDIMEVGGQYVDGVGIVANRTSNGDLLVFRQSSAVAQLRVCSRTWGALLSRLICCGCGGSYRVGDFRHTWTGRRIGNHGQVPCCVCFAIGEDHLHCVRCQKKFEEDDWDSEDS